MKSYSSRFACLVLAQFCIIGCGQGFEASQSPSLSLSSSIPAPVAPILDTALAELSSNVGVSIDAGQFCINVIGEGLSYSWFKDGSVAPYNSNKRCYLISSPTEGDSGQYTVTASNSAGVVTSSAKLDIVGPPTLTNVLPSPTVNIGQAIGAGQFCIPAMGKNLQ